MTAETTGTVTGTFSRRMAVRLDDGRDVTARIRGKKLRPVCGDRVVTSPIDNEEDWLIESVLPRQNELSRPDSRGRREVLASNFDTVVVVAAVRPKPDWFVVDRYLAAAESVDASAIVVLNKMDLAAGGPDPAPLEDYRACGYPVIGASAETGAGLDELARQLQDRTAIIVGQSGVGKSSIINKLIADADQRTAALSASTGEGRHTTVNSVLLDLPGGGAVIDSPGVRDFAPAIDNVADVIGGFREIGLAGQQCRFANCRHLQEPDCAVKSAVDSGQIPARRYESYKRLFHIAEDYVSRSGPGSGL